MDSLADFCDEVLLLPSLKYLNHGNVISPQFPILVMLDIIYSYYVGQDKSEKETLHDHTLRALEDAVYQLRWFTPGTEVELCGLATLAFAFVILNYYDKGAAQVEFNTLSGRLTVVRKGNLYEMDFFHAGIKEEYHTDIYAVSDEKSETALFL